MTNSVADSYKAAGALMKKQMQEQDTQAAKRLGKLKKEDIVIVRGDHDHIEHIFDQAGTPYTLIGPKQLNNYALSPEQTLFVNCIGEHKITKQGNDKIREYVANGGYATTTDWALKAVVEKAFPGYIEHNGESTGNDVVEVHVCGQQFLTGLQNQKLKPQWWLETASYPIRVLRENDVDILIESTQMKRKYKDKPIVVSFPYEQGTVLHMVSHFELQQTKAKRKGMNAKQFAKDILGMSGKDIASLEDQLKGVDADSVEAALASQRFVHNIVTGRRKK